MNKKIAVLASLLLLFTGTAFAAGNDTTTINYSVAAINELNLDGGPYSITINNATAGVDPDPEPYDGTWDITTNCATNAKKITAQINSDMPAGVSLWFDMQETTGAMAFPDYLSSTPINIVTSIDATAQSNLYFFLELEALATAGVVESASKTLTVTLTDS